MKDLSSSRDSYRMSSLSSSSARRYNDYDDPRGGSTEDELYRRRLLKVRKEKRYFGLLRPSKFVPKILIDYSFPHVRRSETLKAYVDSTSVRRTNDDLGVGEIVLYSLMAYT